MKPIPQAEAEKLKRENRELKKRLTALSNVATMVCQGLDLVMKWPESNLRGGRVAQLANLLELETDSALHFELKKDFDTINKIKRAARKWVDTNVK